MTAVVPDFLFAVIEEQLRKVQTDLLARVAKDYNLSEEELITRLLSTKPTKPVSMERIQIIRKSAPRPCASEAERCHARIWNRGRGGQCTRKHIVNAKLCGQHQKKLDKEGTLHYGWIHEPPSPDIFGNGKRPKAMHITVI